LPPHWAAESKRAENPVFAWAARLFGYFRAATWSAPRDRSFHCALVDLAQLDGNKLSTLGNLRPRAGANSALSAAILVA